jgi:ketosteroid isomerase-like protein
MRLILAVTILVGISFVARAADKQEILAVDRAFAAMAKEKGTKAAFEHYLSKQVTHLLPNKNAIFGRDKATAKMSTDPSVVLLQWEPQDGMIAASGDLAYTWGISKVINKRGDKTKYFYGKYTTIWVKEDAKWKVILDMGNTRPAPTD